MQPITRTRAVQFKVTLEEIGLCSVLLCFFIIRSGFCGSTVLWWNLSAALILKVVRSTDYSICTHSFSCVFVLLFLYYSRTPSLQRITVEASRLTRTRRACPQEKNIRVGSVLCWVIAMVTVPLCLTIAFENARDERKSTDDGDYLCMMPM